MSNNFLLVDGTVFILAGVEIEEEIPEPQIPVLGAGGGGISLYEYNYDRILDILEEEEEMIIVFGAHILVD